MKSITLNEDNTPQITLKLTRIPDKFQVEVNGEFYDLVKREPPKEPELKTFEDCWNKVKPRWYIDTVNEITKRNEGYGEIFEERELNNLPTEKNAKQIQAAIKLFVVKQALQGDWEPSSGDDATYVCWDNGFITLVVSGKGGYNPYPFKTKELAQKAIDIAKDIWLDYFGIENK